MSDEEIPSTDEGRREENAESATAADNESTGHTQSPLPPRKAKLAYLYSLTRAREAKTLTAKELTAKFEEMQQQLSQLTTNLASLRTSTSPLTAQPVNEAVQLELTARMAKI